MSQEWPPGIIVHADFLVLPHAAKLDFLRGYLGICLLSEAFQVILCWVSIRAGPLENLVSLFLSICHFLFGLILASPVNYCSHTSALKFLYFIACLCGVIICGMSVSLLWDWDLSTSSGVLKTVPGTWWRACSVCWMEETSCLAEGASWRAVAADQALELQASRPSPGLQCLHLIAQAFVSLFTSLTFALLDCVCMINHNFILTVLHPTKHKKCFKEKEKYTHIDEYNAR